MLTPWTEENPSPIFQYPGSPLLLRFMQNLQEHCIIFSEFHSNGTKLLSLMNYLEVDRYSVHIIICEITE